MSSINYGNLPIEISISFKKYFNFLKRKNKLNLLDNFKLEYYPKGEDDIKKVLNIMNKYSIEDRINIAKKYDDGLQIFFFNRYYSLNEFIQDKHNLMLKDIDYITNIVNYYVLKYKIYYDAPRPYQISKKYNIKLNPVNLLSANTPSFPSGHSAMYYAYYLYFRMIDKTNNYEDILNKGIKSFKKGMASDVNEDNEPKNISDENQDTNKKE